jgi:hypothetical protein
MECRIQDREPMGFVAEAVLQGSTCRNLTAFACFRAHRFAKSELKE